jgi:hypothetical protein
MRSVRSFRPGLELTAEAVKLYKEMPEPAVARLCNTTPTMIYGRLKKACVGRHSRAYYACGTDCDHEYFDVIDTVLDMAAFPTRRVIPLCQKVSQAT